MLRSMLTGACLVALLTACATGQETSKMASVAGRGPVCTTGTGQPISASPAGACPVYGRSYSQEDLQRTGKFDAAPALQQLDPSITVHH